MVFDVLLELFPQKAPKPNKYTIAIGKQVRFARDEAKISQAELAKELSCRRSTISDIENGKADLDALTLAYVAYKFEKPLAYFFPKTVFPNIDLGELTSEEEELLLQFRKISFNDRKKLLAQVRAIADLD